MREIQGKDVKNELEKIDKEIFETFEPKQYSGQDGAEVKAVKNFENSCIVLSQYMPKDAKKMSTLEYFEALEYVRAQNKKNKKRTKNKAHA